MRPRAWVFSVLIALVIAGLIVGFRDGTAASATRFANNPTVVPTQAPPAPSPTAARPPTIISSAPPPLPTVPLIRPAQTGPMPAMLSPEDQERFGITSARDVTQDPTAVTPTPAVRASDAVTTAAAHVGFQAVNARILHGSARTAAGAEVAAWVVLFGGGELPVFGPPGRPSVPPVARRFTGVVVNDSSGEVVTWFMR
jgi:hypothetical protein